MPRRTGLLLATVSISLMLLVPSAVLACEDCLYSPNNFGFCRPPISTHGYVVCEPYVADTFSGRTDCRLDNHCSGGTGGSVGGGGFGDDCEFHDVMGNCMTDNPDTFNWGF